MIKNICFIVGTIILIIYISVKSFYIESLVQLFYSIWEFFYLPHSQYSANLLTPLILNLTLLFPATFLIALSISAWDKTILIETITKLFFKTKENVFIVSIFILSLTFTSLIANFTFGKIPHVVDSIAYLFQAKIFSTGNLSVASPQYPEFFDFPQIFVDQGKWYSRYFFGHPFMLMLGLLADIPWIVGPLLGSLSLVILYFIGRDIYDRKTSAYAVTLGLFSPFFLMVSGSYVSENSSIFFNLLFVLFITKTIKYNDWYYPLLAGIFLGFGFNTRPMDSIAISFPFFTFMIGKIVQKNWLFLRKIITVFLTLIIFFVSFLAYNYLQTGNLFLTPYLKYDPSARLGFGEGFGMMDSGGAGYEYTPLHGILQILDFLLILSTDLYGWPGISLIFVVIFILFGSKNKWDYMMLGCFISVMIAYFFFWGHSRYLGAIYYYVSVPMIFLLTSRGIVQLPSLIGNILIKRPAAEKTKRFIIFFISLLFLDNFFFYLPDRVTTFKESHIKHIIDKGIHNALVFVKTKENNNDFLDDTNYSSAFLRNFPTLDSDIVYARDLSAKKNRLLMDYYPFRKYYSMNLNSTGDFFVLEKY